MIVGVKPVPPRPGNCTVPLAPAMLNSDPASATMTPALDRLIEPPGSTVPAE